MTAVATGAFVDIDEPRTLPVAHRYVHGGFEGTDTRFSLYLPPADSWRGRFFSSIEGGAGGRECRAAGAQPGYRSGDPGSIAFAFAMGAYLVETNGGHIAPVAGPASRGPADPALTAYGAAAASARFGREFAAAVYGRPVRRGYVFGPSGGAWRTVLCVENVMDVWDGAVPFISGMGGGVNFPSLVMNVTRVLGPALRRVVDAHEPGGSGEPFNGLTGQQRLELARLYRAGLQPGAEFSMLHSELEIRVMRVVGQMHSEFDPTYVDDFWHLPGYAGADGDLASALIDRVGAVTRVLSEGDLRALQSRGPGGAAIEDVVAGARPLTAGLAIDLPLGADPRGAVVRMTSGSARGNELTCLDRVGDVLIVAATSAEAVFGLAAGDRVAIENRAYLAFCHLYRHQVDPEYPEAQQLMHGSTPLYPQRNVSVADALTGVRLSGRFNGSMIYVGNLKDTATSPVSGVIGYRERVRAQGGVETERRLRTWFIDNASHVDGSRLPQGAPPVTSTRLLDWGGCIQRALAALIDWVENGVEPPANSGFTYRDGRVELASSASSRGGIQPVVVLKVNGTDSITVPSGADVTLEATAEIPPSGGQLVSIEWDAEGIGTWTDEASSAASAGLGDLRGYTIHTYTRTGTYFPAVRVTTHPGGGFGEEFCRVTNLARARVVVA